MSDSQALDAAAKRLTLALDAFEAAIERRRTADRSQGDLAAQLQAMGNDRARLAGELDSATARARQLEAANREVAARLDSAIETIRTVIGVETP